MGKISAAYLFPHPPIILAEIGKGEEEKARDTLEGVKMLSKDIKKKEPSTIIVISPHGPMFSDAITISMGEILKGDFSKFGFPEIRFEFKNNLDLVKRIITRSNRQGIIIAELDELLEKEHNLSCELDHGVLVPLYFVDKEYKNYKLIHISYGLLEPKDLYRFGMIIQEIVKESDEDVAIIASGDLSHKLTKDGPYPYSPQGKEFDDKIMQLLKEGNMEGIVGFDLKLSERAGECGLRSLMIMAGTLDKYRLNTEIFSYEGPFGVGYGTAKIEIIGQYRDDILEKINKNEEERLKEMKDKENEYVKLARESLEYFIKEGKPLPLPENLSKELTNTRKAVFVTLKSHGILRGCIGTTSPTQDNIAEEIIRNAIHAGTEDPRFPPVGRDELDDIMYSVDILSEPQAISSKEELDIYNYGLIVSKAFKRGLLLPNIEGINSVDEQISITLKKAGIRPNEDYKMERFKVVRHKA